MSFASRLKQAALQVLKKAGAEGQVKFVTKGDYDPSLGTAATTTQLVTTWMALVDLGNSSDESFPNTLIQGGDKVAYVYPADGFPRKIKASTDYIIDASGATWKIVGVSDNNPSATMPVCYFCLVRQ